MRVVDCVQGSDVWMKARCGLITASRMADVLSYLKKGGESQRRADYRTEIIAERLTGLSCDSYVSPEMKWGTEQEPFARAAYEIATGNFLDRPGFVLHSTLDYFGASPDGLCGRGGAEFKCPKTTTHIEWMLAGVVPEEHIPQMDAVMLCCELDWLDFVSFDPRMADEDLQMFVCRLPRDEKRLYSMTGEITRFEKETVLQIERLRGRLRGQGVSGSNDSLFHAQLVQSLHSAADAGGDAGA